MVSQDQKNSIQPINPERRPITLRLSFVKDSVPHLLDVLDFVIEKLEFIPTEKVYLRDGPKNEPIELKDSNGTLLTLIMQQIENRPEFTYINFIQMII